LFEHAQFPDGGVSVEAGLMLMLDRMKTGKLKVFRELNDFFEEFRLYHRRMAKFSPKTTTILCAVRYGLMSLRHARTKAAYDNFRKEINYPKLGIA
jgi:hypothetical protein